MSGAEAEFDVYAENYDTALKQGISISGEDSNFFARNRIAWLSVLLMKHEQEVETVMDFGCGVGTATPFLLNLLGVKSVVGVDVSPKSLEEARRTHQMPRVSFSLIDQLQPHEQFDLVYCNGVFHHIPPDERPEAIDYIYRALKPGGWFALWENNPWNPGARYAMRKCPFDRNAIPLAPPTAQQLISTGNFTIHSTNFLFIFPRVLRYLRAIEPYVARWPIGAQYQVLSRKSE